MLTSKRRWRIVMAMMTLTTTFSLKHTSCWERPLTRNTSANSKSTFLPTLPDEVQSIRGRLAVKIQRLLILCRNCRSWNDRSEYKLPQWIEYVDEEMIPYTSLPRMVRIKESLEEYLDIHQKVDIEESAEDAIF